MSRTMVITAGIGLLLGTTVGWAASGGHDGKAARLDVS